MRTNNVKGSASTAGRGVRVFGWILVIMGILFIATGGFGPENPIEGKVIAMLFFFGGGAALILQGEKTRKIAQRYEEEERANAVNRQMNNMYNMVNMADMDDMLDKEDMEDISEMISMSLDMAKNSIPQMMKQGTFTASTTYSSQTTSKLNNRANGKVSFSTSQTETDFPTGNGAPANTPSQKKSEPVVVACKGCGANNKVMRGSVGECEFCGSPISAG